MKQGKLYTSMVMALLALAIAIYFGVYFVDTLYNPFSTTIAYTYTMNDSVEVEGIIIRDEYLLGEQTGIVESVRREGERVGAGQSVALVHRDQQAQTNQAELDEVTSEIAVIRQVLQEDADILSATNQDDAILASVISLRQSAASQSYSQLDSQVVELKSQVIQRDYAYSGTLSRSTLVARLTQLVAEETTLSSLTSTATSTVYAPVAGLYSTNVDGFEGVLTPSSIDDMTLSQLNGYLTQTPQTDSTVVGKLILGTGWYLAVSIPEDATKGIQIGDTLTVRFGGEFSQDVSMEVVKLSSGEEGDCLMVLYSDRYASDTTLLRQTTVELVYGSDTGIRVPKESLRMDTKTDSEGNVTQTVGVYTNTAGRAEFHAITILAEGQDFYVVEDATGGKDALRAGDEVIVYATDLFDGKQLS